MDYKITSNLVQTSKDARYMIGEIKDNIFDELYMRVTLNDSEIMDLIYEIIKQDTKEDLKDYDLKVEHDFKTYLDIEDDCDLTTQEKKYLTKILTKQYGNEVLKDIINPVIKQKLNTEHYIINKGDYDTDLYMDIDIPLNDFGKKNEICKFLNEIE